jgi:ABC-type Fe3+/spermidine/putrescine transport system ATPase subunit
VTPAATSRLTPDAELRGVTKVFPQGTVAVDDVSLAVARGEFFSLLGPSGCGKTTTLRIVAGLEMPTSGDVLIRGERMGRRPAYRRPTNTVFQRPALFPHLTVEANVAFGLKLERLPNSEIRRRVAEALELVELAGFERRRPHQLSGGQQQRVAIARALVKKPAVLLLDEPLSSLDLRLRVQMQRVLKRIQIESGTTFVYVTHDQTEALTMSDRVGIMNGGRIVQIGTPADVYERPRTRFTATFVGETNLFERSGNGAGTFVSDGLALEVPGPGVAASIRPERVALAAAIEPRSGWNVFDATVEMVVFQGANVQYRLRLPNGRELVAERPNDAAIAVAAGDRLQAGWAAESAVMLES